MYNMNYYIIIYNNNYNSIIIFLIARIRSIIINYHTIIKPSLTVSHSTRGIAIRTHSPHNVSELIIARADIV